MLKFTKDRALALDMGRFAPKPNSSTPGQQEAIVLLAGGASSTLKVGVWECTPGRFSVNRTTTTTISWCRRVSRATGSLMKP